MTLLPAAAPDELPFSVTDACVAHCTFCAQHVPRRTPDLQTSEVVDRLRAMLTQRVPKRLVLTGGEPTLHPRLPELVRQARHAGVAQVWVQTLGVTLADAKRLQLLVVAGLSGVRMTLLGADDAAVAAQTRLDTTWPLQQRALDALLAAQVPLTAHTPIQALTLPLLPAIAAELGRRGVGQWQWQPYVAQGDGAPTALQVSPRMAEPQLIAGLLAAQTAGVQVSVAPGHGWHWCAFAQPQKLASLLVRAPATAHRPVPACATCAVAGQCPGIEPSLAAHLGERAAVPLSDVRKAAWLPVHGGVRDPMHQARNQVLPIARQASAAEQPEHLHELVLRIVHQCNQRCGFCWVDFGGPTMPIAEIGAQIEAARAHGQAPRVALTGGEPTLHPQLAEAIALATQLGAPAVSLQTNAARVDRAMADQLVAAGLTDALVSLHSADAATSDRLTAAPGTWKRSVAGIAALCAAGVETKINHVLTRQTGPQFAEFVQFVADRLLHPRLKLTVAVAGHIDGGPIDPATLPTHSELGPHVARGLAVARDRGVQLVGMTHPCGILPCSVPNALAAFAGVELGTPALHAGRLRDGGIKVPGCATCAFDRHCFGVRSEYAQRHGTDELRSVLAP